MDRIAIISDIHGNMPALEAVLADIDARSIVRIFCLGDVLGKGPQSIETLELVRKRCEKIIMGNWETHVLTANTLSANYVRKQLSDEQIRYISSLPASLFFTMSGKSVKLFHGRDILPDLVQPGAPKEELLQVMDALDEQSDITGFADIHVPFLRWVGGRMVFNTGSVGSSCDSNVHASYAILSGVLGDDIAPIGVEMVRVPYDITRTIHLAKNASDFPFLQEYVTEIQTAIYQRRVLPENISS